MIYAIGDSFTEGGELPGQNFGVPGIGAWPGVLSEMIGKPVINKGRSATGNTRIVKRAVDAVINNAEGIIICWTNYGRIEFADKQGIYDVWPGSGSRRWLTRVPGTEHRSQISDFVNQHYNLKYLYKNWLRQIILVQTLCKARNIPCAMFNAFLIPDIHDYSYSESVKFLLREIDYDMFINNTLTESTMDWTYNTPKMPLGHPGPEGHKIIANKVYEHIRNLGWVS